MAPGFSVTADVHDNRHQEDHLLSIFRKQLPYCMPFMPIAVVPLSLRTPQVISLGRAIL